MKSNSLDTTGPLNRAMAILRYVASQQKPLTIVEISVGLDIPAPTMHRLVGNLESLGFLQRSPGSKKIIVGNALIALGADTIAAAFSMSATHAALQKVSARIGEQCEIGMVRDGYVKYIANIKAESFVGLQFDAGKQGPLHCTSIGKIYLSTLRENQLRRMVAALPLHQFTPNTNTDPERLVAEAKAIKGQGWAKSNEEYVLGVVGCAVPIVSDTGVLIASLGVSVPAARVSLEQLDGFIPVMQEAAKDLAVHILNPE